MTSRFARYEQMEDLEKDVNELPANWVLAEWHPCWEGARIVYPKDGPPFIQNSVCFYARFVQVAMLPKPGGMKAR